MQPIVSGVVYDNKLITGAATGHLYVWVNRTVLRSVQGTNRVVGGKAFVCSMSPEE